MKKIFFVSLLALLFALPARSDAGVSYGVFYSSLSPYGSWVQCNLGYVWRPAHMAHGWRPYLNGRWEWSDCGWYWVSYEPFGWATFHYGRWYYDDYYGWIWIPDETWGPAWVEWRYNDDYVGWAPLPPYATFTVGVGIAYTHHWEAPSHYWNFVTYHNFGSDRVNEYVQPADRTSRIFGNTRTGANIGYSDNRVVNRGIDMTTIERRGNVRIRTAEIIDRSSGEGERVIRNGDRDRIEAFRPNLQGRLRDDMNRPQNVEQSKRPIATDFDQSVRERRQNRTRSIESDSRTFFGPRKDRNEGSNIRRPSAQPAPGRNPVFVPRSENPRRNNPPPEKLNRPPRNVQPGNGTFVRPRPNNPRQPGLRNPMGEKPRQGRVPPQQGKDQGARHPRGRW